MNPEDARSALLQSVGVESPFLCSLATIRKDGGPAVRFVRAKVDQDLILRIPTFDGTGKTEQITADARVSLTCGDTDSDQPGTYFQIDGVAELRRDAAEREACWTPRLKKWFAGPADENYVVIRIEPTSIVALPIGRSADPLVWRSNRT